MIMTNEKKLIQLLQIAVENGLDDWSIDYRFRNKLYRDLAISVMELKVFLYGTMDIHTFSLNDLIGNFEPGKVSFVDALQKANIKYCELKQNEFVPMLTQKYISSIWFSLPTSQRLDWFFGKYDFLINNNSDKGINEKYLYNQSKGN